MEDKIIFASLSEVSEILKQMGLLEIETQDNADMRFESRAKFDYMLIELPVAGRLAEYAGVIQIYFMRDSLLFFAENQKIAHYFESQTVHESDKAEDVLLNFFEHLTCRDASFLDSIEDDVSDLEDKIALDEKVEYADIGALRKRLLSLKRYYEALLDILEDLEENRNGIVKDTVLLSIQRNRVDRLYHDVLNLRDYITQVRESYQAQIDISLNRTMKLFTVITAIFLPLTLIAGWYGMNLKMPEYDIPFMYPIVIGVSIMIIIGIIAYFKKNKWF